VYLFQLSSLYRDPTLEDQIDFATVRIVLEMPGVSVATVASTCVIVLYALLEE